jgi:hypothetical protein
MLFSLPHKGRGPVADDDDEEPLLDIDQALAYLNSRIFLITKSSLYSDCTRGKGPVHTKIRKRLFFRQSDLDQWRRDNMGPFKK